MKTHTFSKVITYYALMLSLLLAFYSSALAQTPGGIRDAATSLDGAPKLFEIRSKATKLDSSISATSTTIPVKSTAKFPSTGSLILNQQEIVFYAGKTAKSFTRVIRGREGTTAVGWLKGASVGWFIIIGSDQRIRNRGRQYDEEFKLPVFLTAGNLKGFITEDLIGNSKPIIFTWNGVRVKDTLSQSKRKLVKPHQKKKTNLRWIRFRHIGTTWSWRDAQTGAMVYDLNSQDIDVSSDGEKWFHLAGPRCLDKLPVPPAQKVANDRNNSSFDSQLLCYDGNRWVLTERKAGTTGVEGCPQYQSNLPARKFSRRRTSPPDDGEDILLGKKKIQ